MVAVAHRVLPKPNDHLVTFSGSSVSLSVVPMSDLVLVRATTEVDRCVDHFIFYMLH